MSLVQIFQFRQRVFVTELALLCRIRPIIDSIAVILNLAC